MSSSPQELGAEEEEPQGVEMDQDFDGELHDVPEGEREEQEDEEGEEGDEERLQQEMGEAGPDEQVRFLSFIWSRVLISFAPCHRLKSSLKQLQQKVGEAGPDKQVRPQWQPN